MKKNLMMTFARTLSQVIEETQTIQQGLEPYYTKLREALDQAQLDQIDAANLADIKAEFQDGTERYRGLQERLQQLQAPARFLGKHRSLVTAYTTYVTACQAMTDSINLDRHQVDQAQFDQAETDQTEAMNRIIRLVQTLMQTQA